MISWLMCCGLAHAQEVVPEPAPAEPLFELSGFVKPVFSAVVRSSALPRDRVSVGLRSSQAGVTLRGRPLPQWRFKAFFVLGGSTVAAVTRASAVDTDNDGAVDRIDTSTRQVLADLVRETSVSFVPTGGLAIRAGQMPVPFTSAAQSADVALLFVDRAGPNQLFLADDDLGAVLELQTPSRTVLAKAGLFNGTGTGPTGGQRGVLYLARVDLQPLGAFSYDETDPSRTEARFGIGAGLIWHPYQAFDGVGFPLVQVHDLRASASLRFGIAGLTVALEGLHRQQTDDLTSRPVVASGAYAQAGWRLPIGLEPIGRLGWAAEDRSFDPRTTVWTEGGFNLYGAFRSPDPDRRDDLRLTLAYQGEHRVTEGESAHGATAAVLLRF
ncbi:MAG: hypothetical protein KTR31_06295 [Myxococcales bacterium]|nr:hypothetical protein [Myxococcales bacterium]